MACDTVAFLERVVGGPAALVGHGDGATVALITALARPHLVTALVFASGVFHHDAWTLGALDRDRTTEDRFRDFHAEVSPDGPGAFDVVAAKLDRMRRGEPTLTVADLSGYPGPALVMIGDEDEEIPLDHLVALRPELFTLLVRVHGDVHVVERTDPPTPPAPPSPSPAARRSAPAPRRRAPAGRTR